MPTVLITGGTGLIGKNLTRHLLTGGYTVMIIGRNRPAVQMPGVKYFQWDIETLQIPAAAIVATDFIINLAGAGVMEKKWNEKYKKVIVDSRVRSGELIIKGLKENPNHVKAIVSASAIGWYGEDPYKIKAGQTFHETDPPSKDFLGGTCRLWEESIEEANTLGIRLVKLRIGIVLSNEGGAYPELIKPFRFGLAPVFGDGKQVMSWIHIDDLCRIFIHALEKENISGVYNAVAPLPVNNKKLILAAAKKIRGQFHIPIHVPQFILKLILGERSIEILKSATVSDEKIKAAGFTFLYPSIDAALNNLTGKNKSVTGPAF